MKIFNHIMKLSKRHGLPVIASNDVHYLYPGDKKAHDLLKSMRMRNTENSGQGYATGEFYLKSAEEMYDVFEEVPEVCERTIEVAEKCAYRFPIKNSWKYPVFSFPQNEKFEHWKVKYMPYHAEYQAFLQYLCVLGLRKIGKSDDKIYKERLKYELRVIFEMSVEGYFLILWDIYRFCRENDIATSCGRGSGAGSLVLYLTEICAINPLDEDMNLMFERFLNPGRCSHFNFEIPDFPIKSWEKRTHNSSLRSKLYDQLETCEDKELLEECFANMVREILPLENQELDGYFNEMIESKMQFSKNAPQSWILYFFGVAPKPTGELKVKKMGSLPDVDSDFDPHRRDEIVEYIKEKYGADKITNIGTYGQYRAKAALRETMKAMGHTHDEATEVSKLIPFNHTLSQSLELANVQAGLARCNVSHDVIRYALKIEGSAFSHVSEHAAGVVISPHSLMDKIPMQKANDSIVSQFDMGDMEKAGYIKFDFLGLSNVAKMAKCNELIERRYGQKLNFKTIRRDDKETLAIFSQGKTETVFQFASSGIRDALRDVGVDSFNDLVAVNALYRPGPMKYISKAMYDRFRAKDDPQWTPGTTYAENKHNPSQIRYIHPDLEEILAPTYNVLTYQEQIMAIAQKIGGFSLGEADVLRKAIGKKIGELFEQCKTKFFDGAKKNGYDDQTIKAIWKMAEDFANYAFNKAHSAAYALLGYWNAYMLSNFAHEWYAAVINEDISDDTKYSRYIEEARKSHIAIERPSIDKSTLECYVEYGEGGTAAIILPLSIVKGIGKNAETVVANRPYDSFKDFCRRAKPDKSLFEKLLGSGALKSFGSSLELARKYSEARDEWREESKTSFLDETVATDVLALFGNDWGRSVDIKNQERA